MTLKTKEKLIQEFRKKFRPFFANWATVCVKCNHIADNHYWNGGGNMEYSGYDACHTCGCVDYDKKTDFIDKIFDYDEKSYARFESFLLHALNEVEEETRREIAEKLSKLPFHPEIEHYDGGTSERQVTYTTDIVALENSLKEKAKSVRFKKR